MPKEKKNSIVWAIIITIAAILLVFVSILLGAHGGVERLVVLCFLASLVVCWFMYVRNSNAILYYLAPIVLLGIGWVALVGWD